MRQALSTLVRLGAFTLLCSLCAGSTAAQECTEAMPIADCVDPAVANAPIPPALPLNCTPPLTCDLGIFSWDLPSSVFTSPDISLGEPFAGDPLFFYDPGQNRFCTKVYARIRNMGGGAAAGCDPACDVTVDFAFKDTNDPADWDNPAVLWQPIGTYRMVVPAPPGALLPGGTHTQQVGVCWHQAAAAALPETFILRAQVSWPAGPDSNAANDTAYTFYDRSAYERTAQIALALDLSGSMLSPMPGGGTRLDEAKSKAMMFTLMVETGNQLGVYGFATNNPANEVPAEMVTYTGTDSLAHAATLADVSEIAAMTAINVPGDRAAAFWGIFGQSAHGCTPIGQGLLRARAGLAELAPPAAGAGKAIVIFSDGFQNVPPAVNTPLPYSCGAAPAGVPIDSAQTFDAEGIEIYSVFFGPQLGWAYNLMDQIRKQTGTGYVYGASTGLQLAAAYYAIRGLVDDMVFFAEEAETSPQGPWPEFEVAFDAAATQATVAVAWPHGDGRTRLAVDYRRQGESDWQSSEPAMPSPDGATAATPGTSFHVFRFAPGPGTTWELRVRQLSPRRGTTAFNAAVFTPVRDAQIQPSLDDADFTAGEPLPIYARLRSAGQPLTGARVEAVVDAPARPFSTTLRRYADRLTAGVVDPDSNRIPAMATQLQNLLAADTGSAELYPTRRLSVTLRDDGTGRDRRADDGLYSGELPGGETEVAGPYDVTLTARATLPSGRTVLRTARLSTLAGVGPADPGKSEVRISVSPPRDDGTRLATVTILPSDRFGNAAFPGSAYKIGVSAPGVTLQGGVTDPLDTTFVQALVLPPGVTRPAVTVTFDGVELPSAAGAVGFARHEASFHLGLAAPHGARASVLSNGPAVGVDYAYRVDPGFALRAELGWNDFDADPGGSLGLLNLNAYLQYRWQSGSWTPYFEAGPGYYDLEQAGSAGGFAAGAGARYRLAPRWSLDLSLHGHRVGGNLDFGFTQLRVGAIYNFR